MPQGLASGAANGMDEDRMRLSNQKFAIPNMILCAVRFQETVVAGNNRLSQASFVNQSLDHGIDQGGLVLEAYASKAETKLRPCIPRTWQAPCAT